MKICTINLDDYSKDYYKINLDNLIDESKKIEYISEADFNYKIVLTSKPFEDFIIGKVLHEKEEVYNFIIAFGAGMLPIRGLLSKHNKLEIVEDERNIIGYRVVNSSLFTMKLLKDISLFLTWGNLLKSKKEKMSTLEKVDRINKRRID